MAKISLETSLRFAEKNGYYGARARIWELEEEIERCHEKTCTCDACKNVRERREKA